MSEPHRENYPIWSPRDSRNTNGMSDGDYSPIATRVIDAERTVLSQNGVMTEWSGINANRETAVCDEQLTVPFCETDACILEQLKHTDTEWIQARSTVEFPTGESKIVHLIAEELSNDAGEIVAIAESFKDISSLVDSRSGEQWIGIPQPTDDASFREALSRLLERASSNDVAIHDRSWKCESAETGERWDVEIATLVGSE